MQRDMDLVRNILKVLEQGDGLTSAPQYVLDKVGELRVEHERLTVLGHLHLMDDAGLITLQWEENERWGSDPMELVAIRMRWQGYEFLAAAMNDTVWRKAQEVAGGLFKSMAIPTLNMLLQSIIKGELKLG